MASPSTWVGAGWNFGAKDLKLNNSAVFAKNSLNLASAQVDGRTKIERYRYQRDRHHRRAEQLSLVEASQLILGKIK